MRFPVSFDMLDPALCVAWRILKLLLKLQKLLLLLAWSLMRGPHNSIKNSNTKKIRVAFPFNVLPKKRIIHRGKRNLVNYLLLPVSRPHIERREIDLSSLGGLHRKMA